MSASKENFKALSEQLGAHQLARELVEAWAAAPCEDDSNKELQKVLHARVEQLRKELADGKD